MANADWIIKAGDTAPVLTDTLTLADDSIPPLQGATLAFVLRSMTATAPVTLTGTASILDRQTGAVQFVPSAADTAKAGMYAAGWVLTLAGGGQMTFPTDGYLTVEIQDSLTSDKSQQLVSLPDAKDYLNISASDRAQDAKLIRVIHAVRPLVEKITGPIIPQVFEEWHDGGQYFVQIRRRPSTGYGTTPILDLIGCEEYRGPSKYVLPVIPDPSAGSTYSVHMDRLGKVTRRSTGGGVTPFPAMPESVHLWYRAGQAEVPWNVYEGTLELLRVNYQSTMGVGSGRLNMADVEDQSSPPMGFFMPRRVRELLAPTRRAPAIA